MTSAWSIMQNYLFFIHHAYRVQIMSFVLMDNHFHLLARFPNANASEAMKYFMRETSRQLSYLDETENHNYGSRFYRSEIRSYHYFLNAYKYVYQNPVRAGICNHPAEYKYSTLNGLIGRQLLLVPVQEDLTLFSSIDSTLNWLSTPATTADVEAIQIALKKPVFEISTDRTTGRKHELETRAL
jgi:putative transposase